MVTENEKPIAQAVLKHLWLEAKNAWKLQMSAIASIATMPSTTTSTPSTAGTAAEEKIPKQLPAGVWSKLIQEYQQQQVGGADRIFPTIELLGAEKTLARVWYEHNTSKLYTPVGLGELVSSRTFTSSGEPNQLAKREKTSTTLTLNDQKLVATPETAWQPRSVLAVLDGLQSIRWCFVLLKMGSEQAIHSYFDWLIRLLRSRPQKTEQYGQFFLTISWKLATAMRSGETFDAAVTPLMKDFDTFTECMAREPAPTKRQVTPDRSTMRKGNGKANQKGQRPHRFQPYGRSPRSWTAGQQDAAGPKTSSSWSSDSRPDWQREPWTSDWKAGK